MTNLFIGSGTYGTVCKYDKNDDIIVKKMALIQNDGIYLLDGNILEALILKKYKAPFIPYVYKFQAFNDPNKTIHPHEFLLWEWNAGKSLHDWAEKASFNEIVQEIEMIAWQMANILKFLKDNRIVHMDLKPANMCYKDRFLTFIDFGFCQIVQDNIPNRWYYGTASYADPGVMHSGVIPEYSYDMMGCGLTLAYLLTKRTQRYIMPGINIKNIGYPDQQELFKDIGLTKIKNKIPQYIYDMITRMTDLDPKTRITPEELLKYFIDKKPYYDTYEIMTVPKTQFTFSPIGNLKLARHGKTVRENASNLITLCGLEEILAITVSVIFNDIITRNQKPITDYVTQNISLEDILIGIQIALECKVVSF